MFANREGIYIIAEAGVNHNGSSELAFQLIDAAAAAGADAVKFQTFKAESLVTKTAEKAPYQKVTSEGGADQYSMLKGLELSKETYFELVLRCKQKGIDFLSTAFDLESLNFLVKELDISVLKIPSGEITNGPFLLAHARAGKKLIVSTGMATLNEIEEALGVLAFGLTGGEKPCRTSFRQALDSEAGKKAVKENVILLHCTTSYPAELKDIHLRALGVLRKTFQVEVGYSDHSEGLLVPVMAATLGVKIIEKHFTLDRRLPGPDHQASLEPDELLEMVQTIRNVEHVLGDKVKKPVKAEMMNRDVVRKSLVASTFIKAGERFTEENITVKRPGFGKSPMDFWDLVGTVSDRSYEDDEVIV